MWLTFLLFQCAVPLGHATGTSVNSAAISAEEQRRFGEEIYLNGMLPSGEPIQATLFGNVAAAGKKVACAVCHLHSGLGSLLEDEILVLPISGTKLYAPLLDQYGIPGTSMKRTMFKSPRPAYTDETLATALLTGKNPTGRDLDWTMPRFRFNNETVRAVVSYLKNLSSVLAPGVTEDEIRFATIITEGISAADREAMVLPLTAFLQQEWNERLLVLAKRSNIRVYQGDLPSTAEKRYRSASLDVWELQGPSETWGSQLETFYNRRPVFAILGGIVPGEWSPIHKFCEKNKIPCIFPNTDLPVVNENDWYTLYFSKGFSLEGEVAAKFLAQDAGLSSETPIIQVSRKTDQGKALTQGFSKIWQKISKASVSNIILSDGEHTGRNFWQKLSASNPQAALVVWLTAADLAGIETLADREPPALFLSATLLGESLRTLPEKVRNFTYIGYPTRLPGDGDYTKSIITSWMQMKQIPVTNMAITSKIFALKSMLPSALMELGVDCYRDFFLDILDGAKDQKTASASYPMLSFGPGKRYAAKGCYIIQLTAGEKPELLKKVDWLYYAGQE